MAIRDMVQGATASSNRGDPELARDGDWNTSCGGGSGGHGSRGFTQYTTFIWDDAVTITSVEFRCLARPGIACNCDGGSASGSYSVELYNALTDSWDITVDSAGTSGGPCFSTPTDSGIKLVTGPWENIKGIRAIVSAHSDCQGGSAQDYTDVFELRAYTQLGGYVVMI